MLGVWDTANVSPELFEVAAMEKKTMLGKKHKMSENWLKLKEVGVSLFVPQFDWRYFTISRNSAPARVAPFGRSPGPKSSANLTRLRPRYPVPRRIPKSSLPPLCNRKRFQVAIV